jgi:arylsulfatase A-like enzyme
MTSRKCYVACISLALVYTTVWATADSPGAEAEPLIGSWALKLPTEEAGWLSVEMQDDQPHVRFMWAVGGVRTAADAVLTDSQLRFTIRQRRAAAEREMVQCQARGDSLLGTWRKASADGTTIERSFSGRRLPPMPPRPNLEEVTFGEPIQLFNGRDLTGWRLRGPGTVNGWSVRDGVLCNDTPKKDFSSYGEYANLRTDAEFEDFQLHIEFRVPQRGNSGVYLRGMYEAQVVDRDSPMQGINGPGAIFGRIAPEFNAGRPGDQWQTYDLTLVDRHVTVVLNGKKVIDNQPVEGPTGGAVSSDVMRPGPIYLQGDHTSVQYRNIVLRPVVSERSARTSDAPIDRPNVIVIFTDDQGWSDLGCQQAVSDLKTPNLDSLASGGVRCLAGYITAPQCSPSRAGLVTGRYQQRFNLDHIPDTPLPLEQVTLAERLGDAGYVCGMVGKWHLDPTVISKRWIAQHHPAQAGKPRGKVQIPHADRVKYSASAQGFHEFFQGQRHRYWANYDLDGNCLANDGQWAQDERFRIDVQTEAALAFVRRNQQRPFFLYLAYFAPHTPLEATTEYLQRFSGPMPERRRHALAMLAGIDDGVGRIMQCLRDAGLEERTLIFFASDNGAPLKMTKPDNPVDTDPSGWDGSLNDPWVGEKGMLTEGGIRVPFLVHWKGQLPEGTVYEPAVISLDIAATSIAAAGLSPDPQLDGTDLLPFLRGQRDGEPHEALYWRFWNQAAIRSGQWKYIQAGNAGKFLFDLNSEAHERENLLDRYPEVAGSLSKKLQQWCAELQPPGLPTGQLNSQERAWYKYYLGLPSSEPDH